MHNNFKFITFLFLLTVIFSQPVAAKSLLNLRPRTPAQQPQDLKTATLQDFQSTFSIMADQAITEGVIAKAELTPEVFQALQTSNLTDIAVFNKDGSPVPFGLFEPKPSVTTDSNNLKIFPIFAGNMEKSIIDLHISVRNNEGLKVAQDINVRNSSDQQLTGYVMVLPEENIFLKSLHFQWDGTLTSRVRLESSTDLQSWTTIASSATLSRLTHGEDTLEVNKITIDRKVAGQYLRLTFLDQPIDFRSVDAATAPADNAEPEYRTQLAKAIPAPQEPVTRQRQKSTAPPLQENILCFDLGGLYPHDSIKLQWPGFGFFRNVHISSRNSLDTPWKYWGSTTLYRIQHNNVLLQNQDYNVQARGVWNTTARYWKIDFGSNTPPQDLTLQISYPPQTIYFLAQGPGPYTLAAGSLKAFIPGQDISPLLNTLDSQGFIKATLGSGSPQASPKNMPDSETSNTPWAKYMLWFFLVLIVLGMSYMAINLLGKVRKE